MSIRRILIISAVSVIVTFALAAACFSGDSKPEPFSLSMRNEVVISLCGITSNLAGDYFLSEMTPPDPAGLELNDVNSFDRFAADYYSKKLSNYSDNTKDAARILFVLTLLPYLKDFSGDNIRNFLSDAVIFIEAETLIYGVTKCVKGLSERPRPYVYNQDVSPEKRSRSISYESFLSGHVSLAFTAAVCAGYVYQNRHPGSPFITPVWITGLSCAAATAGSFAGWIIPRIHKNKRGSATLTSSVAGTAGLGVRFQF